MADVLVYGTVGIDTVLTDHGEARDALGGSASFASVAAAFFAPVRLLSIVGTDFPAEHERMFGQRGVDLAGLEHKPGETFRWTGKYHADMNHRDTLETRLGVMGENYHPKIPAAYSKAKYVLLANMDPVTQAQVLDQMKSPEFIIADTMNLWIDTMRPPLDALVRRVDLLILNDSEARAYTGKASLVDAGNALLTKGPKFVIIKKGEHGALLFSARERGAFPAALLDKVVDPTGAGDTFAGALAGYLASVEAHDAKAIRRGMAYGTVAAAAACEDFSLRGLIDMDRKGLETRLRKYKALAKV
jgi:cytidine kinase